MDLELAKKQIFILVQLGKVVNLDLSGFDEGHEIHKMVQYYYENYFSNIHEVVKFVVGLQNGNGNGNGNRNFIVYTKDFDFVKFE